MAVFETHDGSDAIAVLVTQDVARSALKNGDEFFEGLRGVRWGFGGRFLGAKFVKLGIKPGDDFAHYFAKHDIIIIT